MPAISGHRVSQSFVVLEIIYFYSHVMMWRWVSGLGDPIRASMKMMASRTNTTTVRHLLLFSAE